MTWPTGVTDCHVHLLPGRLAEAVREFFERHIHGALAYPLHHSTVLDALAAAGVTEAWHLPYAHKPGVADGLNDASAELVRRHHRHAVRLVGGATVHPADQRPDAVVGRALDELGLRVLKLHCSVGDFDADDRRLDPVWRLLSRRAVPVVVHAGHHVSGATAAEELEAVDRVAGRFPDARIVIAHAAHPATARALDLVARHGNVYADLTPRVQDPVDIADAALEAHHDRIVFGSDAPNTAVPVEQGVERLRGLSPGAQAGILRENAARLLADQAGR